MKRILLSLFAVAGLSLSAMSAFALPSLQLWSGDSGAVWDPVTETWVIQNDNGMASLTAFATDQDCSSSAGDAFAADCSKGANRTAYLSFAVVSDMAFTGSEDPLSMFGTFDVDGTTLGASASDWNFGTPPVGSVTPPYNDSLSPHGVFPTWYIQYAFKFGGNGTTSVFQTNADDPGYMTDTDKGWRNDFSIDTSNFLLDPASHMALHVDLYTLDANNNVYASAPYSHDAQISVPEPSPVVLLGAGLLMMVLGFRRRRGLMREALVA